MNAFGRARATVVDTKSGVLTRFDTLAPLESET
jgi:hypothetical protein